MAKIQKVDLNLGKIISPLKTKRNSSTNPFKYQDFEGNTIDPLVCADVLVSFKNNEKTNKLKLITSSVMGSMTKLHNSITEPIINFVKRIGTGISSAWDYAKNTNISDIKGLRTISEIMNKDIIDLGKDIGHSITDSVSGLKNGISDRISEKISSINTNVTELGNGIADKWTALIGKIHHSKINKDTSVAELKALWEEEIALAAKEVA